jgi:hypothetical protein
MPNLSEMAAKRQGILKLQLLKENSVLSIVELSETIKNELKYGQLDKIRIFKQRYMRKSLSDFSFQDSEL